MHLTYAGIITEFVHNVQVMLKVAPYLCRDYYRSFGTTSWDCTKLHLTYAGIITPSSCVSSPDV